MRGLGIALAVIGVVVAIIAFFPSTTVPADVPNVLPYGIATTPEVYNLGKLQTRALLFESGCTLFLAGLILFAAGKIIESLNPTTAAITGEDPALSIADFRPAVASEPPPEMTPEQSAAMDRVIYWGIGGIAAVVIAAFVAVGIFAS